MLKYICSYIAKVDNPSYQEGQDLKNFMTNLVADYFTDNSLGRRKI